MPSREQNQRSRHRLGRITAPAPDEPAAGVDALPTPRGWRQRWLPARWQNARLDPGRHGSLALVAVAAAAAVLAAVGVWRERPVPTVVPPASPAVALAPLDAGPSSSAQAQNPQLPSPQSPSAAPTTLVVSVAGRVRNPGLVTVAPGARVADALAGAGGALPGTDLVTLNLAQPLTDGQQILVGIAPPPGSTPISGGAPTGGSATGPSGTASAQGLVNLNTASTAELEDLPGVGPVMAKAILDWRTKNGGFRSVEQLSEVSGIGPARLAQLTPLVAV